MTDIQTENSRPKPPRDRGLTPRLRLGTQVQVPGQRVGQVVAVHRHRDSDWLYSVRYVNEVSSVELAWLGLIDLTVLDGATPNAGA